MNAHRTLDEDAARLFIQSGPWDVQFLAFSEGTNPSSKLDWVSYRYSFRGYPTYAISKPTRQRICTVRAIFKMPYRYGYSLPGHITLLI